MGNGECPLTKQPLILGYYPIRGKAQVIRILCEYLHICYKDMLLSPEEWEKYKIKEAQNWVIKDMPFLIDGTFCVTGTSAIIYYIVEKAKRADLLGKNISDFIKIQSLKNKNDLHQAILGLTCLLRTAEPKEQQKQMNFYWKQKMEPILKKYEAQSQQNNWYFGYISLMDFIMYELTNQMEYNYPKEMKNFPKLIALRNRVAAIPQVDAYQKSPRCCKQFCPRSYFNRYKITTQESSTSCSRSSSAMDVQ